MMIYNQLENIELYEDETNVCAINNALTKFDNAKEFVEELIHHMYNTGNIKAMENALDELVDNWKISLPKKSPRIQTKPHGLFDFAVNLSKSSVVDLT